MSAMSFPDYDSLSSYNYSNAPDKLLQRIPLQLFVLPKYEGTQSAILFGVSVFEFLELVRD